MVIENLEPWELDVSAGFTLRGLHSRPSGKPWIHFLHGNGFCGLTYEHMLKHFSEHYDLFVTDAQGHGDSDSGKKFVGWGSTANLVTEVLDAHSHLFAGSPVTLMGHSFGGAVSTLVMARNPNRFAGAVLLDPIYLPNPVLGFAWVLAKLNLTQYFLPLAKQAKVRQTSWKNREELWRYFYNRGVFKGVADQCLTSYLDHALSKADDGSYALKCPPFIEAGIFANAAFSLWKELPLIDRPVHVAIGRSSFDFLKKVEPKLSHLNSNFSTSLHDGGHCFMLENPDLTAESLLPVVSRIIQES